MHMLLIEGRFKPGTKDEFMNKWTGQILPTLKKQPGFVDEILLFQEGSTEGAGLCFWDSKDQAEHYARDVFPQQADKVKDLMEGTPRVRSYNVEVAETFRISAIKAA
jgi:heme-degrading monooxygenase HmoA